MLSLTGEEKQKHFNFILLILKVHNKDNLKQFHMRLSPLLMYHIPFLLGSHEECSGNDLIRWYPCVQFLSYLTSGRNHLGYEREEISKSQDVPWVLPGSCWKAIWWKQSLPWSPLVRLSSLFSSLWPTVHLPYPNLLWSFFTSSGFRHAVGSPKFWQTCF